MIIITAIPSPLSAAHCISLLSVLADIYAQGLRAKPLPKLYETAVRYEAEPNSGEGFEQWDDPWTVHERGWGDCDDLVLWRLAELRKNGERAGVSMLTKGSRMHVQVRRASGRYEDPSLILLDRGNKGTP